MKAIESQHGLRNEAELDEFLTRVFNDSFEKFKDQKTSLVEQK